MRIIGLDYGTKTVGVAVSDALMITAQPLETIERKSANKLRQTLARIESIIEEYQAERIVLGYPKNMNNTIGERAEAAEQFKEDLERRTGLEVILWDERLSTVEAERILMDTGVRRENRKQYVDKMAAAVILQNYLDSQAHEGQTESSKGLNRMENDSIVFTDEDGNEVAFSVMEQTTLGGVNYLLVTEDGDDEDDGSFLILKENALDSEGEMAAFDIVEDDKELEAVMKIFEELLEDVDLEV